MTSTRTGKERTRFELASPFGLDAFKAPVLDLSTTAPRIVFCTADLLFCVHEFQHDTLCLECPKFVPSCGGFQERWVRLVCLV